MKKKKLISAIVLFGLALSSCKGCDKDKDKDKNQDKNKHDILDRDTSANPKEISPAPMPNLTLIPALNQTMLKEEYERLTKNLPDARVKETVRIASEALKHATGVLNGSISANEAAFNTAKDYLTAADATYAIAEEIASKANRATANYAVAAVAAPVTRTRAACKAILYAQYVVNAVVPNINFADPNAVAAVADEVLTAIRENAATVANLNTEATRDAATPPFVRTIIDDADSDMKDLIKKVEDLKRLFRDWRKSKTLKP